ncbi:MAG: SDR family NAD(P)-dependent oxidoreductase [Betaproteobacteria bacterium]
MTATTPSSATKPLAGQVILVTGATGGLGQVLARAFGAAGATTVLHGRVVRKLEALYDTLTGLGVPEPAILPLDFEHADSQAFAEAAAAVDRQLGRLDAIVHCAALLKRLAPLEHHPVEEWMVVTRVNLAAPAALTRACLPLLRRGPAGKVVFTLDSRGHAPKAYWGSYGAAKAGLEALVHILADEWENTPSMAAIGVIPGPVASPMRKRTHPGGEPSLNPVESLVPLYLQLVGPDGQRFRGQVVDAQTWVAPGI